VPLIGKPTFRLTFVNNGDSGTLEAIRVAGNQINSNVCSPTTPQTWSKISLGDYRILNSFYKVKSKESQHSTNQHVINTRNYVEVGSSLEFLGDYTAAFSAYFRGIIENFFEANWSESQYSFISIIHDIIRLLRCEGHGGILAARELWRLGIMLLKAADLESPPIIELMAWSCIATKVIPRGPSFDLIMLQLRDDLTDPTIMPIVPDMKLGFFIYQQAENLVDEGEIDMEILEQFKYTAWFRAQEQNILKSLQSLFPDIWKWDRDWSVDDSKHQESHFDLLDHLLLVTTCKFSARAFINGILHQSGINMRYAPYRESWKDLKLELSIMMANHILNRVPWKPTASRSGINSSHLAYRQEAFCYDLNQYTDSQMTNAQQRFFDILEDEKFLQAMQSLMMSEIARIDVSPSNLTSEELQRWNTISTGTEIPCCPDVPIAPSLATSDSSDYRSMKRIKLIAEEVRNEVRRNMRSGIIDRDVRDVVGAAKATDIEDGEIGSEAEKSDRDESVDSLVSDLEDLFYR
jgi:hypothetical protein